MKKYCFGCWLAFCFGCWHGAWQPKQADSRFPVDRGAVRFGPAMPDDDESNEMTDMTETEVSRDSRVADPDRQRLESGILRS
jgi:hypothetical protein